MSQKHKETIFEQELVAHLTSYGWLEGDDAHYDRALALYPDDLIGWLQETQPEEWEKLGKWHQGDPTHPLLKRVAKLLDEEGPLPLLRNGCKDGNARLTLCQFKPSHGFNPQLSQRYEKVRCRVVRQVHYSLHNQNSIDLVLFVNGIPLATLELKTDFTQSVHDAIRQYQQDRPTKDPTTRQEEPLLAFNRRTLVHFAVSSDEVHMTTKLEGAITRFLPFNLGNNQGAGNPANPDGYRTSYLWERVLQRDNWLDILGRFIYLEKSKETNKAKKLIFPRFHQWEVVTKLLQTVRQERAGHRYLVQHSAGSGKSNSIAWLAHQLASLHDANDQKIFDSIIVVTDRTVLDDQLQENIFDIDHKSGLVSWVKRDEGAKSQQLVQSLIESKPIIIVTIQTFPHVLEAIQAQTSLHQRNYAVLADEAHSSQTGASAGWLKRVLTSDQIEEGEEVSSEDLLLASMEARKQPSNVSFFAFTATPKAKTIELFGRKASPTALPEPFHVYSMQQAIEEKFILDVLKNYTPYKLAYRLAHEGREMDDAEIDKSQGLKQLARWVRLHPYNISQKVAIIIEHFRKQIAWQLNGKAKAMVVTASRKEAVRYKLAMDKYISDQAYGDLHTLVAFSGEVNDSESGPHPFSEANMNPSLQGSDLREAFKGDYQLLIVANKFQTGFDQPLLVAMYVDKRLAGVNAVQTLSRLNRIFPGKEETFVLDFVNESEEILAAFAPYHKTAQLSDVSDPNIIHDLQSKLDSQRIYTFAEVDIFAYAYFHPTGKQQHLQAHIAPAVDRYRDRLREAEEANNKTAFDELAIFRKDLTSFVRAYEFLSQIFDYGDSDLEKHYVFFKHLIPWLKSENRNQPIDLSSVELTHYRLSDQGQRQIKLGEGKEEYKLTPLTALGTADPHEPEMAVLSALISQMNELFAGDLSDADLVTYARHITGKMLENAELAQQAASNSKEQFAIGDFSRIFVDTVIEGLDNYQSMAEQVLNKEQTRKGFESMVLDLVYKGFESMRRERAGG